MTDIDPEDPILGIISLGPAAVVDDSMVVVHALRTFCRLDGEQQEFALSKIDHHHVILVGHGRDYVEGLADWVLEGGEISLQPGSEDFEDDQ